MPICGMLSLKQTLQDLILWPILGVQNKESSLKINAASLNLQGTEKTPLPQSIAPLFPLLNPGDGGLLSFPAPKSSRVLISFVPLPMPIHSMGNFRAEPTYLLPTSKGMLGSDKLLKRHF